MNRFSLPARLFALWLLLLPFGPCFAGPASDEDWRRALAGPWVEAYVMGVEQKTYHPDGAFESHLRIPLPERDLEIRSSGSWSVADGHLQLVVRESSRPEFLAPGKENRFRLVSLEGKRLVTEDADGVAGVLCRPLEPEHRALIERYIDEVEAAQVKKALETQRREMIEQLKAYEYAGKSEASDRLLTERVLAFLEKAGRFESFREYYIYLYGSTFSASEIRAILDFYASEAGRAIRRKQPEIFERAQRDARNRMALISPGLNLLIQSTLREIQRPGGS
ncbi:MAG: DUF2059 domain-containing protein [Desulfobacterales bacterium]